jgi:uncharacterized membrane protein
VNPPTDREATMTSQTTDAHSEPMSPQRAFGHTMSDAADRLVDRSPGLDHAAAALRQAIAPVAGDGAPQALRDALRGSWLGHPLHPIVVVLPVGAWTLTSVMDLLGEERAADLCLRAGVLTAGTAALSGAAQWNDVTDLQRPRRVGVVHALLNTVATGTYVASWVLRARGRRGAGVATAAGGLAITMLSGWLGGHLSYTLGVGVEDDAVERRAGGPAGPGSADQLPLPTVS